MSIPASTLVTIKNKMNIQNMVHRTMKENGDIESIIMSRDKNDLVEYTLVFSSEEQKTMFIMKYL